MADRLRLSIDVSAVPSNPVGAGQYTLQLVRALAGRRETDLLVVARRGDGRRWSAVAPGQRSMEVAPAIRPFRLAWEQVRLPALLERTGVEVHHGPHYTMPERAKVPTVVTIHDLSFFEAPEWHQRSKVLLFRRAIRVAAHRSAAVICPSQTTADELARWCRVDAEVVVAHHGVDADRFRPTEPSPGWDAAMLAGLHGFPAATGSAATGSAATGSAGTGSAATGSAGTGSAGTGGGSSLADGTPYLVFVGTLEPRKDVPNLVHAFARIADRHRDVRLVLAGGAGWGARQVDEAVLASGIGHRIIRTGYVSDDVVPALIRSAVAVVYPALYEGFGLPALEAMACGTPLITTSGSAMEEVAGGSATLVPPGNRNALADALDERLSRGAPDEVARQRGLEIAARFTWATSADKHLKAYRIAVAEGVPNGVSWRTR